jgi:hypothetical protein
MSDAYAHAADPPTVAIAYNDDGTVHALCWTWETGQNYAMHEGRVVVAVADDGITDIDTAQARYDFERAAYRDNNGLPDTQPDHNHIWGRLETSRFAGTAHRRCLVDDCSIINAYDDDEIAGLDAYPFAFDTEPHEED